ncbi:superinfection immunity protein [Streptomyces sp. NBC_01230]|uniref:superinfection immunity protein n=1 Tax=Streptomyces sp. NBC_01230 TaxID=2903784 RepID=UPI003FA3D41E
MDDRGTPRESNAWPIFWFNLLSGWTIVGFVVAFVLAVSRHAASGRGILGPTTLTLILLRGWSDHPPKIISNARLLRLAMATRVCPSPGKMCGTHRSHQHA